MPWGNNLIQTNLHLFSVTNLSQKAALVYFVIHLHLLHYRPSIYSRKKNQQPCLLPHMVEILYSPPPVHPSACLSIHLSMSLSICPSQNMIGKDCAQTNHQCSPNPVRHIVGKVWWTGLIFVVLEIKKSWIMAVLVGRIHFKLQATIKWHEWVCYVLEVPVEHLASHCYNTYCSLCISLL